MQQINLNYSLKNIGLPSHNSYLRKLIDKTENFVQRIRWKTHFFLHNNSEDIRTDRSKTYGLKSKHCAPPVKELRPFEEDIASMIERVKFQNVNDNFIQELEKDKRKINASKNIFVFADKTRNIYEMDAPAYNKLLTENVTKTYKHAHDNIKNEINQELKTITDDLKISNRIDPMNETPAFISLKDHKQDFENHPKCRLINPAKSQLGKVSKLILDNINNKIRVHTHVNQWHNSTDAISWFQSIQDKQRKSFISFDIVDFYPSISEQLLDRSIAWAKQFTEISDRDIAIIKHTRKSLLFHQNHTWSKCNTDNTFDVTMGSYNGAEICELIGLFILNTLQDHFGKNVGLYRDDGLAVVNTRSGRLCDKKRKELTTATFEDLGLKITAMTNQHRSNFLDLTFDLNDGTYKCYRKPNDEPLYINRSSNHPPPIIRKLPHSVNRQINVLSCDRKKLLSSSSYIQ